ncbi:MAG: hypothetical protein ACI84C_002926 [Flavobacteriales bacterium]
MFLEMTSWDGQGAYTLTGENILETFTVTITINGLQPGINQLVITAEEGCTQSFENFVPVLFTG